MTWDVTCFAVADLHLRRWTLRSRAVQNRTGRTWKMCAHSVLVLVASWSQWLHGLRCGSAAVGLLELRVWIPPAGNGYLSLVSVVFDVRSGRSLVRRSPTECGVCECDLETSTVSRPWPTGAVEHKISLCLLTIGFQNYFIMLKKKTPWP